MTELRELIERLKHGKHDQSTHGRRGRRGGGGASGGGSKPTSYPPDFTKYDIEAVEMSKQLDYNGFNGRPTSNNTETKNEANRAASAINESSPRGYSVYGTTYPGLKIMDNGDVVGVQYPAIGGMDRGTHSQRQIDKAMRALEENGYRAQYIRDSNFEGIVVSR